MTCKSEITFLNEMIKMDHNLKLNEIAIWSEALAQCNCKMNSSYVFFCSDIVLFTGDLDKKKTSITNLPC